MSGFGGAAPGGKGGAGGQSTVRGKKPSDKVKWAYFGEQRGASGVTKNLGWVRVGSAKWNSYVHRVGNKNGSVGRIPGSAHPNQGPHRPGLVPTRYVVLKTGVHPGKVVKTGPGAQRPGKGPAWHVHTSEPRSRGPQGQGHCRLSEPF